MHRLAEATGLGLDDMLFLGDAIFPGGNDYPVNPAGVDSVRVRDVDPFEAEAWMSPQPRQPIGLQRPVVVRVQCIDAHHGVAAREQPFGHVHTHEARRSGDDHGHVRPTSPSDPVA